ncbi:MAG: HD domain-containing protein [Oscillospiraceae bacterium]
MKKAEFTVIEAYMKEKMNDSSHDFLHIYRVLYAALEIAQAHDDIDYDILIAACLLHDVGRAAQTENLELDHAEIGAEMSVEFLTGVGWSKERAEAVSDCVYTHRHRKNREPGSMEAKILFDADKLDAAGALGVARTLVYEGTISEPTYILDNDGMVRVDASNAEISSFFQEFNYKLRGVYSKFHTEEAKRMASGRKAIALEFYDRLLDEVTQLHTSGPKLVEEIIED